MALPSSMSTLSAYKNKEAVYIAEVAAIDRKLLELGRKIRLLLTVELPHFHSQIEFLTNTGNIDMEEPQQSVMSAHSDPQVETLEEAAGPFAIRHFPQKPALLSQAQEAPLQASSHLQKRVSFSFDEVETAEMLPISQVG